MADVEFPIRILVSAEGAKKGSQQTEDALDRVEKKGKRVNSALRTAFQAITFLGGVHALVRLEDQADNVEDRIKSVTRSTEEFNAVYEELLALSNRTATALAGNAETFARLTRVQDVLGTSLRQNLQIIEIVNSVLRASGDSADEARTGLNRLVVALTDGEIQGRELTSVLRQLPAIADLLAKQLGVSQQELISLGNRGQLSVEKIISALLAARAEAKRMNDEEISTLSEGLVRLQNLGVAAFRALAEESRKWGKSLSDAQGSLEDMAGAGGPFEKALAEVGLSLGRLAGIIPVVEDAQKKQTTTTGKQTRVTQELGSALEGIVTLNDTLDRQSDNKTSAAEQKRADAVFELNRALEEERRIQEALLRQGEPAARVQELLNDLAKKGIELTQTQVAQLNKQAAAVQKIADAAKLKQELLGPELELQRQLDAVEQLRAEALGNATGEGVRNAEMLNLALERSAERTLRLRLETEELRNELSGNFRIGLIDSIREITSVGEAIQEGVRNTFKTTEDSLVSLIRTGKINFKDFANSVLDDIARILIRLLILQGIELFAGTGGIGGLIGGIAAGGAGRQHGGHVTPGGQYLVGERGPELFTPTEPGRIMPNPVGPGPGFGGSPEVKLLVVNVVDPKEVENVIASGAVDRVLVNRVSRNKRAMDQARRE